MFGIWSYRFKLPKKRNMILNPKGEVESEHSSPPSPKSSSSHTSSQSSSEDEIKPNEGGLLVVRRMLDQVPKEFENKRENIFHSRCQINNKTCSLIIDSGSCVNVASTRVVDKLGLKTIPHAKPYKLSWLSEEGEIKVVKQVLINFSIGNYKNDIMWLSTYGSNSYFTRKTMEIW